MPVVGGYDTTYNGGYNWYDDGDFYLAKLTRPAPTECLLSCPAFASPSFGYAPLTVAFTVQATATGCPSPPSFSWDFGDGQSSSEQNPAHTYAEPGSYTWTLTVGLDDKVCSPSGMIQVQPRPAPGDCNADGIVTIGEVQKAINMFLGTEPVGCFVDCDGNGSISIGEVQKVINAFLGVQASC